MEDIKTIIWALEHYDFKLDCVPEKVVNMINELLNGYKKLQQENQQYKNAWEELKEEIMKKEKLYDRCVEALFLPNESNKSLELKQNYGKGFHFGSKLTNGYIDKIMQELEQKYNLGGE